MLLHLSRTTSDNKDLHIVIVSTLAVAAIVVHTTGVCPSHACMKAANK